MSWTEIMPRFRPDSAEFRDLHDRYIAIAARISRGKNPHYSNQEIRANYAVGVEFSPAGLIADISRDLDMHEDLLNNPREILYDQTYVMPTPILYVRSKIKHLFKRSYKWVKYDPFGQGYEKSYFATIPRDIVRIFCEFLDVQPEYSLTTERGSIMWNGDHFRLLVAAENGMQWDDGEPYVFSEETEREFHNCEHMYKNLHGYVAGVVVKYDDPWQHNDFDTQFHDLPDRNGLTEPIIGYTNNYLDRMPDTGRIGTRKLILLNMLTNNIVQICDNIHDIVRITEHHIFFHNPHGFLMRVDVKMEPQTPIFSECPFPYVQVGNNMLVIHDFDCVTGSNKYVEVSWQGCHYRITADFLFDISYFDQKILYLNNKGWNVVPLHHLFDV